MGNVNREIFLMEMKQTHHSVRPKSVQICENGSRSMRTSFFPTSIRKDCNVMVVGSFGARFFMPGRRF
jgi:hypothetical protein